VYTHKSLLNYFFFWEMIVNYYLMSKRVLFLGEQGKRINNLAFNDVD
jgi:hypothetical protein